MSRKKKVLPLLENVEITAVAAEGKALARVGAIIMTAIDSSRPLGLRCIPLAVAVVF